MDTAGEKCSPSTVANGAYPVRCTEEVLLPLFADESLQAAMASQRRPASNSSPAAPPELRLVLLGRKGAGKSAAGNTILGGAGRFESGKPTEECVTRRADIAGRRVTVVDTPGWEWYYPLNKTPNWVRRETLRSVSLCPPGPHVVLLVVRSCASVTDAYIREIEEHLEPLGRAVWGHAMLLFTRGDELGLTSMEQRILTSGPALQRLLHMCGGSYCVVNNLSKGDGTQIGELMRKLGNKGGNIGHLEMDNAVLSGLEADGKRGARERRKKQRQMEAQVQRGTIKAALMSDAPQGSELDAHRSFSRAPRRLPEVRLVLLGERETGKSSAGNTILGESGFFQAGAVTEECVRRQAEVAQRFVTVVDTPGWEAGVAGATPERVKREIVGSVALCPPGPHALLLMLRVDTLVRAGHVREHLELLGEGVWRHTILLFTHGDQLREGVDIEQHVQGGGRDLQWLLEKCRGRCHIISSVDGGGRGSGGSAKVTELLEKVEKMASLNRCEAFSSLVQDVRDLSRQRNEKFDQRLKEVGDKMLRREVELKNMREREMKSIRWFFDRKKKLKSPGKADVQKEEEEDEDEDRRKGKERKHDIGELEERMRWLTEDKEKEIQDLSIENERIRVSLNQSRRERDGAMLNLEQRERDIEELKERSDEQQAKLLDLERATVENEHEREQREDDTRAQTQEWRKEVEENLELHKKEKAEWMKKIESLKAEMDETKRHCGDVVGRKEEENNREVTRLEEKLKREMEIKLVERDKEQNELRRKAIQEIKLQHEEEMARKISESTEKVKVQHQEDIDQSLKEKAHEMERVRQRHDNEIRDMQRENQRQVTNLKKQFEKENEDHGEAKKKETAELEQKYHAHMKEKILENEKEKERIHLNHKKHMAQKMREEERDTEALKLAHQKEKDGKTNEHKEDMERVQQQYMEKIRDIEKERRRETEEHKEQVAKETAKQLQEREMEIKELKLKYSAEMEEKNLENEKEKEIINRNKDKCILERLQERDRQTEELKRQHVEEVEERMRQSEKEKERCKKETEEKETEMEEMKLNVEELKKRLRQEEEKEAERLNYKNHIEQRLEEKDKEIEKMKLSVDKMKEKLQQGEEEESDRRHHRREMEQRLEDKDREIDEIRERLKQLQQTEEEREADRLTTKRQLGQKLEENERVGERAKEEMKLLQRKLKEKEAEIDSRETRWREEQKEKDEKRETEMNQLIEIVDEKTAEIRQAECRLAQKDSEVDEAKRTCASYFKEIEDLKESNENQTSSVIEMQRRQRTKDAEMLEKLREKDEELEHLRRRDGDNGKEIVQLKLTIEQTKSELKELTEKMEIAMTSMIREYEKEIARATENMESVTREKDDALARLQEESRKSISSVTEKYEESRKRVEELQEQREKMRKEADNFKLKYEQLKDESEEEVRKHFRGYEEKESEIRSVLAERDLEVGALTDANDKLQAEVVGRRERLGGAEAQINELRETFERQLTEKQREFRTKEEEIEEKQKEIRQRERDVGRNEGELRERGLRLDAKEVELTEKEVKLGGEERELRNLEGNLETQQKERKRRARNTEEKEREIESLLRALEGKQQELSGHGQHLQRKVKGLKEKEHCLKREEQELLCWKSELQTRSEHVSATTQQLDEMVRDLTSLREELDQKEKTVKMSIERLGKWEARLEAREAELNEVERGQREADNHASGEGLAHEAYLFSPGAAVEHAEDDVHIMYSEVSGRRDKGREGDRGERMKDREDQTTKMARSAVKGNKCHIGTLEEIDGSEEKEGMGGRGAETRDPERERVMQECRSFSQSQGHGSSNGDHSPTVDLRVLVLGESWSSRSPAGVTILGGEVPAHDGSTFRSWRGQTAARHLAVVEPLGLRWRDGPDPTNTSPRNGLLDSIARCHPGPHVVLLLMPAFVTCTRKYRRAVEEHVGWLGEGIWQRAVVLFTWGETLGVSAEQHILRNGELLGLVEKCGGGYHVLTGKKTNSGTEGLLEKMEEVVALNSGERCLV